MVRITIRTSTALLAGFLSWACSTPPTIVSKNATAPAPVSQGPVTSGELRLRAPDGWVSERPSSSMRVAQYQLPPAGGDAEAASLVVYYFGAGQGGSVDANLDRWTNQMQQPDGAASKSRARTDTTTVNGMKVTMLDIAGTYAGGDMGGGGGIGQSRPNFRMRAAVIETAKGAYFVKLVGPDKTVTKWDQAFLEFIKSAEFKG
ncbi:MAG: hypothetical protein WAV20_17900 [Blastocatellia bacterium]